MVEVRDLSVLYQEREALSRINFTLDRGKFLAIIGPNGGGKTTLLKTLAGIIQPTGGSVKINGTEAARFPKEKLGYIPQAKRISTTFPATAAELILSGKKRKWSWIISANQKKEILAIMEKLAIRHLYDRQIRQLSGGELQRVYLARAFYRQPEIILFDEPITGLDVKAGEDFYALLEDYQKEMPGATLIMVTHDIQTAFSHASQVLVLNRKQIECGAPATALNEQCLQEAFGHSGHHHSLFQVLGAKK